MRNKALIIIILLNISPITLAKDISLNHLEQLRNGLLLYQTNRYAQAALEWLTVSENLIKNERNAEKLQQAGFTQLLATIAFEAATDPACYSSWGLALQYYLEGRTTWPEQREELLETLNSFNNRLSMTDPDTGQPSLSNTELLLILLNDELKFTDYQGPQPGLLSNNETEDDSINVSRDYYARPLALIDAEQSDEGRSRYNAELDNNDNEENNNILIGRGVPTSSEENLNIGEDLTVISDEDQSQTTEEIFFINTENSESPIISDALATDNNEEITAEQQESAEALQNIPSIRTDGVDYTLDFTNEHMQIARTAWRYFKHNLQHNTGLYNSVNQYERATLWDIGSSLAALVAAEQLGIINQAEFQEAMQIKLTTLQQIPLYNNELPNREYSTNGGKMINLKNTVGSRGSGWSALDVGRTLIWLKIVSLWYPDFKKSINDLVQQWSFDRLAKKNQMNGVWFNGRQEKLRQEGRLGYEQYAASGYALWDVALSRAFDYDDTKSFTLYDISLKHDTRNYAFLTSEPFFLAFMELGGLDEKFKSLANRIYTVQKRHWQETKKLTAYSESSIHKKPWFLYNLIYNKNTQTPWECVSHSNKPAQHCASISTKASFAWYALYNDDYSKQLISRIQALTHPKYGFYSGIYQDDTTNKALTVNTNAIILEAMLYIKRGGKSFLDFTPAATQNITGKPVVSHGLWDEE